MVDIHKCSSLWFRGLNWQSFCNVSVAFKALNVLYLLARYLICKSLLQLGSGPQLCRGSARHHSASQRLVRFRYILRDEKPSRAEGSRQEPVHLAVVACGQRLDETLTMLKSAVALGRQPLLFHIFAEDELHSGFRAAVSTCLTPARPVYWALLMRRGVNHWP